MRHDDDHWDDDVPTPRLRSVARVGRLYLQALKRTSPAVYHFLRAKRPQIRFRWGRHEWHVRRDGLVQIERPEEGAILDAGDGGAGPDGLPFVPRKAGEQEADPYLFRTPDEGVEVADPDEPVELDEEAMAAEVARRMGKRTDVEEEELEIPEELRNHEALAGEIARVRDLLQGLDDVEDFDLIQELSDDLYHLYKAVDYKIKLHHSSEAKAELGKLFKM